MKYYQVRIEDSKYIKENDVAIWTVLFLESGEMENLCWPRADLGKALGIKGEITPEHMDKFCEDMKGKELKLAIEGEPSITTEAAREARMINEKIFDSMKDPFEELQGG